MDFDHAYFANLQWGPFNIIQYTWPHIFAFHDISAGYSFEIDYKNKDGLLDPEDEQTIKNYKRAYNILYEIVAPNVTDLYADKKKRKMNLDDLEPSVADEVTKIVNKLETKWNQDREELGLPKIIEVDISDEVYQSRRAKTKKVCVDV